MQTNSIKPSHPQSQTQTPTKVKSRGSFLRRASISCRNCLFFSVITILFVFITTTTRAPKSSHSPTTFVSLKHYDACESDRIYVYDLPSKFNKQLLTNCHYKEQSQCDMAVNNGFSGRAYKLASIMPNTLSPAWFRTDQFSLEVIYHYRMLNYKCRTKQAQSATAFYIPFYAGLALSKYLYNNQTKEERDLLGEKLLTWLQAQPYWSRSNGSDHFMAIGRISCDFRRLTDPDKPWGSNFLNLPLMQTTTRLIIERNPEDYYDIAVPYPSGFHPHSDSQLSEWQEFVRTRNRSRLVSFVGATRPGVKNDFRAFLLKQCRSESELCRLVDCSVTHCVDDNSEIVDAFMHTDFCLQPRGDSPTRRSVFDCMISGSVPVFFWNGTFDYEWFFPDEQASYSVFIDYDDVINGTSIWGVLAGYSREKVEMMRERVIELMPKIVYAMPSGGLKSTRDAFDIAVDGVLRRFKKRRDVEIVQPGVMM